MQTIPKYYRVTKDMSKVCRSLYRKHLSKDQAIDAERGTNQYAIDYCHAHGYDESYIRQVYVDKMNDLDFNMKSNSDEMLLIIDNLDEDEHASFNLAYLNPEQMQPEYWTKTLKRIFETEKWRNDVPSINWEPCVICKCVKHFYYQMQTRCADEAMTQFYVCAECRKTTKINS